MKTNSLKRKLYSHLKANTCPICDSKLSKSLHCSNKEHLFVFYISQASRILSIKFSLVNKISAPYIYLDFSNSSSTIYLHNFKTIQLNFIIPTNFDNLQTILFLIDKLNVLQ